MPDKKALWVEKYRPETLDNYIFHDPAQKTAITHMLDEGSIPHLLLAGVQGSGKTTLALILIKALDIDPMDLLTLNASDENSVDVMRDKIKGFVSTYAVGDLKIVHLEEADYLTANAQAVLRRMMEEYSETARFILTCNYTSKIIPAVKSRCQEFKFNRHNIDDVTEFVATILISEKVNFDLTRLDKYVRVGYPDIRKIINLVQQNSKTGTLATLEHAEGSGEYKLQLLRHIEEDDWQAARKLACSSVTAEDWEEVYRFLYENLHKTPKFSDQRLWESGIFAIADHLYRHALVADPEINGAAMFIKLSQLGSKK